MNTDKIKMRMRSERISLALTIRSFKKIKKIITDAPWEPIFSND